MSIIDDLFSAVSGNPSGGGADPTAGMNEYFAWLKQQQQAQATDTARQKEQAVTISNVRRGEFLSRSGYSGDVNVGQAVERTAATLDAQMQQLLPKTDPRGNQAGGRISNAGGTGPARAPGSPAAPPPTAATTAAEQYTTYEAALAKQQADTLDAYRTISGIKYAAQDAETAVKTQITSDTTPTEAATLLTQVEAAQQQYNFYDYSQLIEQLKNLANPPPPTATTTTTPQYQGHGG